MTATDTNYPKHPLGVGKIISESFSILFGNLKSVMILGFVPSLLGLILSVASIGPLALTGGASEDDPEALLRAFEDFSVPLFIVSNLATIVIYGMTMALLVQMAYDAKLKRAITPGQYLAPALRAAVPIVVLSFVIGIFITIGFLALVVPGLLIWAMYALMVPAVMIERVGFGGMGRSASLTKEYRWPVLGALIVLAICGTVLGMIGQFFVGLIFGALGSVGIGLFVGLVAQALATAISYGVSGIGTALIYARLREIKEGVSVDQLASVFD